MAPTYGKDDAQMGWMNWGTEMAMYKMCGCLVSVRLGRAMCVSNMGR